MSQNYNYITEIEASAVHLCLYRQERDVYFLADADVLGTVKLHVIKEVIRTVCQIKVRNILEFHCVTLRAFFCLIILSRYVK